MSQTMTGMEEGRAVARTVGAGLAVFVAAAGASVLMASRASPPWVPLALLSTSGILAVLVGGLVWLSGRGRRGGTSTATIRPDSSALERLQVDSQGRKRLLAAGDIDWIEAAGNYVRLHSGDESFLYRSSLGSLSAALDPSRFIRVHKSAVVNVTAVRVVDPIATGDAVLELASGAKVRMSRRFAAAFNQRTGR